jgi:hypothetical protein
MKRFAGSRWVAVGVAALVGVLMMTVAVVATALPGTRSASSLGFDSDLVTDLFSPAMRILYAAALLAAIYRWLVRPRVAKRVRPRAAMSPWVTLAGLAVVAAIVLLVLPNLHLSPPGETATTFLTTTTGAGDANASPTGAVRAVGPDVWVVVAAAIAGLAYVLLRRRDRPTPSVGSAPTGPASIPDVWVESALDQSDLRSRVLAAYRRVAGRASEVGLGRGGAETVTAHLRRLEDRGGAEPTRRLAQLYNRARFSSHPISAPEATSAEGVSDQIAERIEGAPRH